ncbi:retrovirus-related pol polyprotein from transposon TNT 1-94 [Tanacetum coccineum]
MFMLGPKPLSVYDQQLKHGLGYPNPYTLKQAISQCPKLYLASSLGNSEISLNIRDTEDTLDDASKSQQKVYEKINDPIAVANKQNCWTIDYAQINALYKDFVPQKELSAEQKYFPSSFIPSDKNSNATPSIPASMPIHKTRFSKDSTLSKSLDTTYVVSKPKIDVESTSKANDKWPFKKHMTGDRSLLKNFIEKFMGTVRFGNDNFAAITGYGDYIQGNITICHVYYVEGLGHNLFSVGQFCNGDLEVVFHSKTCYVRNLEGDDLLTGGRESTKIPSVRLDLVDGLLKFKYGKDYLCSACERGKSKKASHPPKLVPSDHSKLELLHMDLCGPMRKDETPEIIKKFIAQAQLNYKAKVCKIRTDNGTEFKNVTLKAHYEKLGIMQQFLTTRTPHQNEVVKRRNRTLVEVARTMLIFSRLPEFLWAKAVATACFTQNRSIIYTRHNKTPYELLHRRKPNVEYFHVFGSLCYPTNDRDDLGKMKPKVDIGVFIADIMNTPSKEDLENLFGPMFEEYFETRSFDTPINSATQPTQFHEDSSSTSSIIVEEHVAPPIETTPDEQTSPISLTNAEEVNQEDSADFNGNLDFVPYNTSSHEEIESSTAALEPSNM